MNQLDTCAVADTQYKNFQSCDSNIRISTAAIEMLKNAGDGSYLAPRESCLFCEHVLV